MKIGIVEIAARARVSEATVSRVLNRRHGVAARTREAVEQAMRELGYERPARGGMVAVVVPSLTDPLHAEFAERIQAELAPRGLTAAVWPAQPGTPQESALLASLAEHAVGCVVLLRGGEGRDDADLEAHASLDRRGVPTVGVNTAALPGSPVFSADDRRAAELAVEHLYALGHRTIGLAAGPGGNAATTRLTGGFLDELTRRGMPHPDRWLVTQHASVEGGQAAAGVLLALGVTGIVTADDRMALGVIQGARRLGRSVPSDVSVVGYGGASVFQYADPPLTAVRRPVDRLASEAARTAADLAGGRTVPRGELLFAPELVVRGRRRRLHLTRSLRRRPHVSRPPARQPFVAPPVRPLTNCFCRTR